ncbi:MAG: nitrate reductase maturation protein NarM [Leptolyngbyaceae cyanobacterium RU_5_1]|nr:nitrate reductase maturation protein NarM [Leptolyngbyaceae cyanobacterium RU_5_1]
MPQFFEFESDFVESLRCIPMQMRLKLDTCGIKLKLPEWNQLSQEERLRLVEVRCETETEIQSYRSTLHCLVLAQTGTPPSELPIDPEPLWLNTSTIPDSVLEKAAEFGVAIALPQWAALTPLQRFALIKLSRSSHENRNFLPALKEFKLC